MKFKLKVKTGKHIADGSFEEILAGRTFVSETALHVSFPDKFELVSEIEDGPTFTTQVPSDPEDEEGEEDDDGEDVTDSFPEAKENALQVFKQGRRYIAKDAETGDYLVGEPVTKDKIVKAITAYLEG